MDDQLRLRRRRRLRSGGLLRGKKRRGSGELGFHRPLPAARLGSERLRAQQGPRLQGACSGEHQAPQHPPATEAHAAAGGGLPGQALPGQAPLPAARPGPPSAAAPAHQGALPRDGSDQRRAVPSPPRTDEDGGAALRCAALPAAMVPSYGGAPRACRYRGQLPPRVGHLLPEPLKLCLLSRAGCPGREEAPALPEGVPAGEGSLSGYLWKASALRAGKAPPCHPNSQCPPRGQWRPSVAGARGTRQGSSQRFLRRKRPEDTKQSSGGL